MKLCKLRKDTRRMISADKANTSVREYFPFEGAGEFGVLSGIEITSDDSNLYLAMSSDEMLWLSQRLIETVRENVTRKDSQP